MCNQIVICNPRVAWIPKYRWRAWWRHQMETFSALLAICAGNSSVPGKFPHKGQWRGALMLSLICVWINGWENNREAGDLRRYRGNTFYYDVTIMERVSINLHVKMGIQLKSINGHRWYYLHIKAILLFRGADLNNMSHFSVNKWCKIL